MPDIDQSVVRSRGRLALLAIVVYALAVRIALLDRPFHRDPEGTSAYYGILARNYIRRPIAQTLGVPVQNMGRSNAPVYYSHHPPLVPMLIAGTYAMFGFRADSSELPPDWQTRFSTALFTLGCLVTIYVMARNRAGPRAALLAACVFAALPITNFYGGFPDVVGSQLVFFILLTIGAYERLWEKPGAKPLAAMIVAFAFAGFTDWVAFFLPAVIGIHFVATRPLRQWGWILGFGVGCASLFFLAYGHIWLVERDWLWMSDKIVRRTGSISDQKKLITGLEWAAVATSRAAHLYTLPVLALTAVWVALQAFKAVRDSRGARLVGTLLAWAVLHIFIGRQGVFHHEWWWWPLAPGVAIASAIVIDRAMSGVARIGWRAGYLDGAVVILLIALASWSTITTFVALHKPPGMFKDYASHSITDIGRAIRTVVPPDTAVIIVEKDETIGLWYYADRPIIADIWTVNALQERLPDPQTADLPFGFTEPWHQAPQRLIFPKRYQPWAEPLFEYLQSHYTAYNAPPEVAEKFFVFDLTQPTIRP